MATKRPSRKKGFWRFIGRFWLFILGVDAIVFVFRQIRVLWDRAHRITYRKDTFARACRRHKLTGENLEDIARVYVIQKDICFTFLLAAFYFTVIGLAWGELEFWSGGVLTFAVAMVSGFIATFRWWQIKTRKLAGEGGSVRNFIWQGHFGQMFSLGPFTRILAILVLFLAPVFFATPALAPAAPVGQSYSGSNPNVGLIMQQAEQDPSREMLGGVLGPMQGWLGTDNNLSPLSEMFEVYNVIVLAAGVFFFLYSATSAIVQTAHEGEFLGKRYHTVWWPIRTLIGVGGVAPIFKGFSAAQAVVGIATVFGIGAANLVWGAGASAFTTYIGNPIASPTVAMQDPAVQGVLNAQACMEGYNREAAIIEEGGGIVMPRLKPSISVVTGSWDQHNGVSLVYGGDSGSGFAPDVCGGVRISAFDVSHSREARATGAPGIWTSLGSEPPYTEDELRNAYKNALTVLNDELLPITNQVLDRGYEEGQNYPDPSKIADAQNNFMKTIAAGLKDPITKGNSDFSQFMQGEGKSWFLAGAIYPKLAAINRQVMDAANVQPVVIAPEATPDSNRGIEARGMSVGLGLMEGFLNSCGRAHDTSIRREGESSLNGNNGGTVQELISKSISAKLALMAIQELVDGQGRQGKEYSGDLFTTLPNVGYKLLSFGSTAWVVSAGLGAFAPNATGTLFTALVLTILLPLMACGAILAFYIPVLPFVVWYTGILSWIIIVGEAVVAAPLWAITHMDTKGEGMGERTTHGYLFLINLLFRPLLMVIGLVFGGIMVLFMGTMLKGGIGVLLGLGGAGVDGVPSLFMIIAMIILFTIMASMTVTTAFSLVQIVPNQVLTWVGSHGKGVQGLSEEHVKGGAMAFGRGAQGAGESGMKEIKSASKGWAEAAAKGNTGPGKGGGF